MIKRTLLIAALVTGGIVGAANAANSEFKNCSISPASPQKTFIETFTNWMSSTACWVVMMPP